MAKLSRAEKINELRTVLAVFVAVVNDSGADQHKSVCALVDKMHDDFGVWKKTGRETGDDVEKE